MRKSKNVIREQPSYIEMEIKHKGKLVGITIFDKGDLPTVLKHSWYARPTDHGTYVYANCNPHGLHRYIVGLKNGDARICDHINRNTLDNRRCNLRIVDATQSARNIGIYKNNPTGLMGVRRFLKTDKWYAGIHANGHYYSSKLCKTKEEAAKERKKMEDKYWGDRR